MTASCPKCAPGSGACTRNEIAINIGDRKTTENILAKGAFTVAPADAAHVVEADYFGMATGRTVNKAEKSGLTFVRSAHVDAPVIEEFPLTMECIVRDVQDWGGERRFIGEVVNARVDEAILDEEGRVDFAHMRPIVYDSTRRIYRVVGEEVGGAWDAGRVLM
ncbi:flavin reductase family protein [Adlercreutzia caecimuris]|uniref:flavin reductase family protein n=1 Tax=Adlercreutzia caecimuris TaxID=671266 RepID=UPI003F73BF1D